MREEEREREKSGELEDENEREKWGEKKKETISNLCLF